MPGFRRRPSRLKRPVQRGAMHAEQAGDLGDRAAVVADQLAGERDLVGVEDRARPEAHAARLGRDPPGAGPLDDQRPLASDRLASELGGLRGM